MLSTLALAVLWPFVDKPLGGKVLMVISETKGVTQADLLSVAAVVVVIVQAVRLHIRSRPDDPAAQ